MDKEKTGIITKVIDKISDATGWLLTREGSMQSAVDYLVKSIKSDKEIPEIAKAAMISEARKLIKSYKNQTDVFEMASVYLDGSENVNAVDDDWVSYFFENAKNVSNDEVKAIWAKILSNEIKQPGTVSKMLINTLSVIDKKDAFTFEQLCKFVLFNTQMTPYTIIYLNGNEDYFKIFGITTELLLRLDKLNLIHFSNTNIRIKGSLELVDTDSKYSIRSSNGEVDVGNVLLTDEGIQLFKAIDTEKLQNHLKMCVQCWETCGYQINQFPRQTKP